MTLSIVCVCVHDIDWHFKMIEEIFNWNITVANWFMSYTTAAAAAAAAATEATSHACSTWTATSIGLHFWPKKFSVLIICTIFVLAPVDYLHFNQNIITTKLGYLSLAACLPRLRSVYRLWSRHAAYERFLPMASDASAVFERPTYSAGNCIRHSAVLQTAVFQAASSGVGVCAIVCASVCVGVRRP